MKRFLMAALSLGAVCGMGALASAATPRAELRHAVCQTARDPANRGISITAEMRPLSHTVKMGLKFDLLVRHKRSGPTSVISGRDLGVWIYPTHPKTLGQRPSDVWIVNHPVAQLPYAPAYYHFRVSFRWYGSHGRVIGNAVRSGATCYQPELRPDLVVSAIHVAADPAHPRRDRYTASIRNRGASSTGQPVTVQFTDNGAATKTRSIPALSAHSKTTVSFLGPSCNPVTPPTITADPSGLIDDYNRANNSLLASC